jgi:gas vesicle protein
MGDTADALAHKANVPARARETLVEKAGAVRDRIGGAASRVGETAPDRRQVTQGARQAVGVAQENPLGLAIGAVALGFLVGMLVPSTGVEEERIGPVADRVKETAREVGHEAVERAQQVGQTAMEHGRAAAQEVTEAVREEGRAHGQELAEHARERARDTAEEVRSERD